MSTATTTLSTTSLLAPVTAGERHWNLASTSGIVPGVRLFAGRELVAVEQITGIGSIVVVRRGVDGTVATPHSTAETLYIGRGDQFYSTDPVGVPPAQVLVAPYINVLNGVLWAPQGDETADGLAARTWQPITTTQTIGPLGVRVNTTTTPS